MKVRVVDLRAQPERVHRVARQHRTATQQPAGLPIREPEFGLVERELTIDPASEPVADERRIDSAVEGLVFGLIVADQRGNQVRAVLIALLDRLRHVVDDDERHFWDGVPFPLVGQTDMVDREVVDDWLDTALSRGFARRCVEARDEVGRARTNDAANIQCVAPAPSCATAAPEPRATASDRR